jgi:endo-1,4-beta-xylanase
LGLRPILQEFVAEIHGIGRIGTRQTMFFGAGMAVFQGLRSFIRIASCQFAPLALAPNDERPATPTMVGLAESYCLKSQTRCDHRPLQKYLPEAKWTGVSSEGKCSKLIVRREKLGGRMKWRVMILALSVTAVYPGFSSEILMEWIPVKSTPAQLLHEQSLRDTANVSGFLIGTAVRPAQLSEAAYSSTLAREFNMVEPEDVLKWETIHPAPQSFDFSQGDQIVDFASRHDMRVRGHTLVWHQQNPKWLTGGKYSSIELAQILENHIKTVVGHYRGRIFAWDVVNEAFDELHPGELRSTIWRDQPGIGATGGSAPGYSYIERCFRWAHEADPQALLFYNEAEAETINPKSDAVYAMVRDFRHRGVPIDGVGFQMHIPNLRADVASISANISRFTALGVQVQITEMDVALPVDAEGNPRSDDLQAQANIYREIAQACLSRSGCTAIQTWGFTDKYSWIGSHSKKTKGAPLLFDRNYQPKPAYEALRNALETKNGR